MLLLSPQTSDSGPGVGTKHCCFSSVVEHFLGKEEVTSSSLVNSSENQRSVMNRSLIFCFESRTKARKGRYPNPCENRYTIGFVFDDANSTVDASSVTLVVKGIKETTGDNSSSDKTIFNVLSSRVAVKSQNT